LETWLVMTCNTVNACVHILRGYKEISATTIQTQDDNDCASGHNLMHVAHNVSDLLLHHE
jgi:hypothetical protein